MSLQEDFQPFGTIQFNNDTATYIASSDWEGLRTSWEIRMYPSQIENNETVELPSISNVDEELWPYEWKIIG